MENYLATTKNKIPTCITSFTKHKNINTTLSQRNWIEKYMCKNRNVWLCFHAALETMNQVTEADQSA